MDLINNLEEKEDACAAVKRLYAVADEAAARGDLDGSLANTDPAIEAYDRTGRRIPYAEIVEMAPLGLGAECSTVFESCEAAEKGLLVTFLSDTLLANSAGDTSPRMVIRAHERHLWVHTEAGWRIQGSWRLSSRIMNENDL